MDKLQWFKFTPGDWMMGKIQRCPEVTQARFIRLCCLYWNKESNLSLEDAEIEIDKEHLDILLNKKIVSNIDGFIEIQFLSEQLLDINTKSNERSIAGAIGNLKRWHKAIYKKYEKGDYTLQEALDIAKQSHSDSIPIAEGSQNIADKKRKEEIRKEQFINFWNLYDKKTGKDKCEKKWKALKDDERKKIIDVLQKYIDSTPDKQYRKNPITWLNQKCWEDEIEETPKRERTDAEKYLAGEIPMPKIRMGL